MSSLIACSRSVESTTKPFLFTRFVATANGVGFPDCWRSRAAAHEAAWHAAVITNTVSTRNTYPSLASSDSVQWDFSWASTCGAVVVRRAVPLKTEEHTSELQS